MQSSIIFQGKKIVYKVMGTGKMVVLLHGFGEDGNIWQYQKEKLSHHYQLVIPDLPGSGQSELLDNGNINVYAEAVYEIIKTEKNSQGIYNDIRCTVIGHSMGGYITLAIAEKYPDILNGFGLFHSSAFADSEEKIITRKKAIDFINKNSAIAFLETSIPGLFYKPANSNWPEKLIKQGDAFTKEALIQYYNAMINRQERINVLKQSSTPVLFIIGEHDKAVPFENSLQQCYLPAQSYIYILRHSAHMGMLEETEKSNEILLQFLEHCK